MAIFRPGPLVSGISGNLGSVNFVSGARAPVVRRRIVKTDPASPEQLRVRTAYNRLWKIWQALTAAEQTPWTVAALQFPRTNRLGLDNPLTGWQLFYEINFYDVWQVTPISPPFVPLPPPLSAAQALTDLVLTATRDLAFQLTVRSLIPSTDASHPGLLTIKAWRPHTTAIKKVYRAPRRLLRVPFEATTISIADEFTQIFGTPAIGEALRFEFTHIADDAPTAPDAPLLTRQSAIVVRTLRVTETNPIPFAPPAMTYDRVNDFSLRGADLTGVANSKTMTLSVFLRTTTSGGATRVVMANAANRYTFNLDGSQRLTFFIRDAGGATAVNCRINTPLPTDGTWHNFCLSIDTATDTITAAVDGTAVAPVITTLVTDAIMDWSQVNHSIGSRVASTDLYEGCISMLWFSITEQLDFTSEDVRALFVTATDTPVDLGGAGQFPTGVSPIVFLAGGDGSQNGGTGGAYVNNAGVGACVSAP